MCLFISELLAEFTAVKAQNMKSGYPMKHTEVSCTCGITKTYRPVFGHNPAHRKSRWTKVLSRRPSPKNYGWWIINKKRDYEILRHRQRRRERFGNKGKWQEKKRNILEQKHKTEDNTHTHTHTQIHGWKYQHKIYGWMHTRTPTNTHKHMHAFKLQLWEAISFIYKQTCWWKLIKAAM